KSHRQEMLAGLGAYQQASKRYAAAEEELMRLTRAVSLLHAGLEIDPEEYRLDDGTMPAATARMRKSRLALPRLSPGRFGVESDAGARLSSALQLLFVPAVCRRLADGEAMRDEVELLIPEARFVSDLIADLLPFRELFSTLGALCEELHKHARDQQFLAAF